jgi:hypothetical protein
MSWIRDTFGAVIGTEGCSAGVAASVQFAHGVMTPVIGWGDPDLKNKQSKYYLGAYYPPEEPQVFFKPVPLKEEYRYIYFEPRFSQRTTFGDSIEMVANFGAGDFQYGDTTLGKESILVLRRDGGKPQVYVPQ